MQKIFLALATVFMFHTAMNASHFASSAYGNHGPDEWYSIETYSYPEYNQLSYNRNLGVSNGRVYLSPTGLTIGEAGDYEVDIAAILMNPNEGNLLVPIYLSIDETFDPENTNPIGGVGVIAPGDLHTISGSGFLKNVPEGARLSLVIMNGGYPLPQSVLVAGWGINVKKID